LAIKLFKIAPPKPWALNSGYADIILAESKAMHHYMVREGLAMEKIKVVGSLSDDVLASNIDNLTKRKKEVCLKFNLDPQKPTILCAIPPDMLHGSRVNVCEFKSYKKLVEFWVETISKFTNYNIVISLHPSAEYKDICYIEKRWKVKIIQESIINLIPLCDIFVACISATIQWAVTCGKPVINYDVYHYNYDDYKKVDGVVTVDSKDDFIKEMSKIANDQGYFAKLEKIQKSIASEWGMLDGKSGERIIKAINELSIEMDKKGNG
jgi:UDP-N-acetylglucosamine 2-epimerase